MNGEEPSWFKFPAVILCGAMAFSFAAGSLTTAALVHANQAKADSGRVFQLMIYHTLPGKAPELASVFGRLSKLQSRYLNVVGYWIPSEDPAWQNTFIY